MVPMGEGVGPRLPSTVVDRDGKGERNITEDLLYQRSHLCPFTPVEAARQGRNCQRLDPQDDDVGFEADQTGTEVFHRRFGPKMPFCGQVEQVPIGGIGEEGEAARSGMEGFEERNLTKPIAELTSEATTHMEVVADTMSQCRTGGVEDVTVCLMPDEKRHDRCGMALTKGRNYSKL